MFFAKYTLFAEKMVLHEEKSFILKIFLLKKTFFTEKNIYENVNIYIYIYIFNHFRNIFLCRKCLCYK